MKLKSLFRLFILTVLIFACSKTEENVPLTTPLDDITGARLVRKASLVNQEIVFTVVTNDGVDVTDQSTFFVNGEALSSNTFSSNVIGEFEVYGVYFANGTEITTQTETFRVIIPKQKILVEDYTGTWCGFCPLVLDAVQTLETETEDIVVIAIHQTAVSFPDPMHYDDVDQLQQQFEIEGLPAARINRTTVWNSPYETSSVTSIAGQETNLGVGIYSELSGTELKVQVSVTYEEGSENGDKLVLYLLEDDIVYDQINYMDSDSTSPFYNMGNPIPDFVHNHVLRESISNPFGDEIPLTSGLVEYKANYVVNISSDYNPENLSLVAVVVNANNDAKNAQKAHLNEDKPYE